MTESSVSRVFSIFTIRLRHERHVVQARQRAREIAALLGFEHQEQIRIATAASELARNAFRYATNGAVEFLVQANFPQYFVISVTDSGPGIANLAGILDGKYVSRTGLGKGIIGTRRLMDRFEITSSPAGTRVETGKALPATAALVDPDQIRKIAIQLASTGAADPFDEVERQNQELLRTLAELREQQDQLAALNRELEDTNRGVVALYAELDQNADDLRRVSDLKTSFLSNLSHEFRTPLNSITSLCQLLINRSDGELTEEQEKQVVFIRRSAAELTELVNDLLDLAKVEAGKIDVRPRHFEVQDLFGALRGMLRPLLTGNSLELTFEAEPDLPTLYTDEGKLSQILRNLISNALKFTRRGYVRITARLAEDGMIDFSVEDTGIGIAPENREKIFEEFVQIESEIQAKVKGTGLGLPLSKRLTELLGGTLSVQSQVEVGSTFQVRLPIRISQSVSDLVPRPQTSPTAGPTILFVEDNIETSFVHQTSLRSSNFNLVFALNLPEARAAMRMIRPAVVALDRFIDGEDSLYYIRELRATGYLGPVLVISVVDEEEAAVNAGADAFLAKPVAPFRLENTLQRLLGNPGSNTVLLADDDEVARYLLGEALTKLGYKIIETHNGREAIQIIGNHILNGVFLDIIMPDLTGFEVLREIKRNPATAALPVIIHSSKELSELEMNELEGAGALIFPKSEFSSEEGPEKLRAVLAAAGTGL
jgi:signal transduction histidine kinase/DNA-binding response OmpR family regulator